MPAFLSGPGIVTDLIGAQTNFRQALSRVMHHPKLERIISRQELAEALAVAIQMGGGPSVNYAADALRAFDEFGAQKVAGDVARTRVSLEPA